MTLKQTIRKINTLKHLIGQKAPKWNSPILEIIPAPVNDKFTNYLKAYQKTGDIEKAIVKTKADRFDILLIFSPPQTDTSLVYQWYSFFYTSQARLTKKDLLAYEDVKMTLKQQKAAMQNAYSIMQNQFELVQSFFEKGNKKMPAA